MRLFLVLITVAFSLRAYPAQAQRRNNDGFQRHNGQMHVLRNGQLRPMTRDAHLPTGTTVTKDGFVVAADGQRTELREGQGCDLQGRVVAVVPNAAGGLALASPAARTGRAPASTRAVAPTGEVRAVLSELFGQESQRKANRYDEDDEPEERGRARGKKWKEKKRKKGKKWDD